MSLERRYIRLGMSSVFQLPVWRFNELHTKRTLDTIRKEKGRFNAEYHTVTAAFNAIETFLQSTLSGQRFQSVNAYRNLLKKDPKHVNALIDLMAANLSSKSEKQKLSDALKKDILDKQRNLMVGKACLELGMALVEVGQISDFEQTYNSQTDRNMPVIQKPETSLEHLNEIDPLLINHLQFQSENEIERLMADTYATLFTSSQTSVMRDRIMEAVMYLEEGLARIGTDLPEDELLVWKYYLARAYKSLVFKSHKTGFEVHLHNTWRIRAIKLFYNVIHGSDSNLNDIQKEILKTNKARSYVYLGEILHQKAKAEDTELWLSGVQDFEFLELLDKDAEFGELIEKTKKSIIFAFNIAEELCPDDTFVLVHYGNYLVNYAHLTQKDSDQEHDTDKAISMLSSAIEKDSTNWLAHAIRMTARKNLYTITTRKGSGRGTHTISLLQDAVNDGEFCFTYFPTIRSMLEFSRVLHWLADQTKTVAGFEIDEHCLQKAIDVLVTIESRFGHHNSPWVYKERANCHFLRKEIEEALIFIELAFYTSKATVSVSFIQLCSYFIDVIEGRRLESSCAFVLRRLKTAVATLVQTYRADVKMQQFGTPALDDAANEQFLSKRDAFLNEHLNTNANSIKRAINDVLYFLDKTANAVINDVIKPDSQIAMEKPNLRGLLYCEFVSKVLERVFEKMDSLSEYVDDETPIWSSSLDAEEKFRSPGTNIPSPSKHRQPYNQDGKQYDFFILHSDADCDWVVCCLLQQLEYGQYGFKGSVQERDFEEGKTIFENIKDKINNSNKILIVISRNTTKDFIEYLEKRQVLDCLRVTGEHYEDTYVLNVGVEERPQQLVYFPFIKCGPLPLDLNEVRNVLALPRHSKHQERPRVYIQPTEVEHDRQINILSAKCTVDEDREIIASNILELGIPQVPMFDSVRQVENAESIFKYGFPESNVLILYERHVVCFDAQKRLAKWVAYKLTNEDIEGPGNRDACKGFQSDKRLPAEIQQTKSVFTANLTRGHMKPAADSKASQNAMRESFKFTNIYPEYKNNKMWASVEVYIRKKVLKDFQEVRIFIVPAFRSKDSDPFVTYSTAGETRAAVPTHIFKFVIAFAKTGEGETLEGETLEGENLEKTSEGETLVTGTFMVRNTTGYGMKEIKEGNDAFQRMFDKEVVTDIRTIENDTGIQFRKMLERNGHRYNETLLEKCHFITADEFKEVEKKHIGEKKNKTKKKGDSKETVKYNEETVKDSKKKLNNSEERVNDSKETVNDSKETVNDNEETVNDSKETVNDNEETVNDSKETVNDNEETVNDSKETVNDNEETVNDSKETVNDNEGTVNNSKETVNDSEETVSDSKETVNDNEETVNDSKETVNDNEENVNDSKETVNDSKETVNDSKETVNDSKETVNENEETVNDSKETVNDNEETVNDSKETVNDNEETVNDSKETVNDNEETVNDSKETVNDNEETVNDSKETVNDNEETVNDSKETVNDNEETVNDSKETVNDNEETVNDSKETVNDSKETVNDKEETVNDGKETVNDNEETVNDSKETVNDIEETVNGSQETVNDGEETVKDSETV